MLTSCYSQLTCFASSDAGLAIITVFKIGFGLTYKLGTGLVVARREDGSWSAPSAIGLAGLGYGPQVSSELVKL